ncbi:MAG: multifunctional oxoglutarate decarboxylase/oxoglutarate dehydrogenase thiamine pyrophosphate-binding subunit/dihydrolipoyllysine-residue succinyltransferase subunit [bacterium]|nr:multifunctional oxoglutarate decarboxylase/oxoglutarate dehydrogenase thiamine pyrophosphate-binding subunit/dihydrolipoyllysine-residue succinyltransferase subunit [bacterium]
MTVPESPAPAEPEITELDEAFGSNSWLVDQMQALYDTAPMSVSSAWRKFFAAGGVDAYRRSRLEGSAANGIPQPPEHEFDEDLAEVTPMVGPPALIAKRMDESRELPTATSVRSLPAKLLEVNRRMINNQLTRLDEGSKVSFTHLIGWAAVKALQARPAMNAAYTSLEGVPHHVRYKHINLGLAMDIERRDGSRTLLVPNIKSVEEMDFRTYWAAYEDIVTRARRGRITPDDFAGTTATLTNPGTVGTVQSVPRLMPGQGVIIGVGAIGFPPEYEGADPATIALAGIGRTMNITSTYDHRVIQGAESGIFLQRMHELLLGADDFYGEVFRSMGIPYVPAVWAPDENPLRGSQKWTEKQARVFQLINMYRVRGHLIADLDPLRQQPPSIHTELDPLSYGLTIWDLDRRFATGGLAGQHEMQLGDILGHLRDVYGRTTGIEYMHIQDPVQKQWIQQQMEDGASELDKGEKLRILRLLGKAEAFERFLHTKFLGAKRFSLEGSESTIAMLDALLNAAATSGITKVTMGMAHRGRLNVLANIAGKSLESLFREFRGHERFPDDHNFSGDVKYHLGTTGVHVAPDGTEVAIQVAANPSHLEAVNPVLEGITRAIQDTLGDDAVDQVLPVLLHGDAAFSGQGVVGETFNLSQLDGYFTGGTVHLVINNQVGFTTASRDARSSHYATDIAKAIQAPILHVNGDDPEACVRAARIAFEYRSRFHRDVVLDLVGYRRLGHNEGDEPSYTQPKMYAAIKDHPSPRQIYVERQLRRGDLTEAEATESLTAYRDEMENALRNSQDSTAPMEEPPSEDEPPTPLMTAISAEVANRVSGGLRTYPNGFALHPKLGKLMDQRHQLFADGHADWAMAEALAWGSLSLQGVPVRLAGEDSQRGTFSHRHAVLVDYNNEDEFTPLRHLDPDQAPLRIYDSLLSEFAAMGFEYGYSVASPDTLVMWEAQFGDFVNGAQVIIDQFLATGYDKWRQRCSLVLMLPHGFEGQGPEHSSARLERFLTNAAEDNIRVAVPSTPAQLFHLFRTQALHPVKRPLIIITAKSLLRTRQTYSPMAEITGGTLQAVIPDSEVRDGARRVVLCTGKVYYDLAGHRAENNIDDVALIRTEILYPFPAEAIRQALAPYGDAEVVWVQEEPANMGAWRFMSRYLFVDAGITSRGIYRKESASPATGNPRAHARQQQMLIEKTFAQ